jgi:hypothetical protein
MPRENDRTSGIVLPHDLDAAAAGDGRSKPVPPPGGDDQPDTILLLPGALLVAMLAKLLATFVLVDFRFATFLQ